MQSSPIYREIYDSQLGNGVQPLSLPGLAEASTGDGSSQA
jgi:hypothetical protein